jgi:hypothetical protein
MASTWQNLNGPVSLCQMLTLPAPGPNTREPLRAEVDNICSTEPGAYVIWRPHLTKMSMSHSVAGRGFDSPKPLGPILEVANSASGSQPQEPAETAPLDIAFRSDPKARAMREVQLGECSPTPTLEPMQRKLVIWAPPHVSNHSCQMLVRGSRSTAPAMLVLERVAKLQLVGVPETAETRKPDIPLTVFPGLSSHSDVDVAWAGCNEPRPALNLRLISPRMRVPLPPIEQR